LIVVKAREKQSTSWIIITVALDMIIEVNDAGEILVPAELVLAPPHTRLEADREGDSVVLKPFRSNLRCERTALVCCLFWKAG
jgi:hypothetical protein